MTGTNELTGSPGKDKGHRRERHTGTLLATIGRMLCETRSVTIISSGGTGESPNNQRTITERLVGGSTLEAGAS